ncbi:MAG: YjbQ family protein [Chitinispirillaceae bacterium]|nr:YjbQ family protein [Chitinispirillaceae bacterium]
MVHGSMITLQTKGFSDIHDITGEVRKVIDASSVTDGIVVVSVIGSTASISTIEYEGALVTDVEELLERMIPHTIRSRHSETWGDDNGFSHMRATLMGPSLTIPVAGGAPVLGTWQQIIVIDHDNRPRSRKIYVQVMGE